MIAISGDNRARVGACREVITEALLIARPDWCKRDVTDHLCVTALYTERGGECVCLLAYDICEMAPAQACRLKEAVASELGAAPDCVHTFCSHTHSSSCETDHDVDCLVDKSREAARKARESAAAVAEVHFLRVDTGRKYSINRRTKDGALGTWCLMQSQGCVDDGEAVDGTERVRERMMHYGAACGEAAAIKGPFLASRETDPFLDLVLFPKTGGAYAGGLVRFTAHAVVCSAGYWRPNLGRDYPGVLCDRLSAEYGCPILFLQGPCGDHRPRHRDVGIEERDRIAGGLADELIARNNEFERFEFDALGNATTSVACPLSDEFPRSLPEAEERLERASERLDALPHGDEWLRQRKDLAEARAFQANARRVWRGEAYLRQEECRAREAELAISHVSFGNVHLLNFEGELFSTVTPGLENAADGPVIVTSFADGVTGYLMEAEDLAQGGYERTWALFKPEAVSGLRRAAVELVGRR